MSDLRNAEEVAADYRACGCPREAHEPFCDHFQVAEQNRLGQIEAAARAYLQDCDRYEELTQFRDWQSIDIEYPDGGPSDAALRRLLGLEART